MLQIAFCNNFSNPMYSSEVTDDVRKTSTFFLPSEIIEYVDNHSLSKEELISLVIEKGLQYSTEKTYLTAVLKVDNKFFRRTPNEIRNRYYNGGGPMTQSHIGVELEAYKRVKKGNIPTKVDDQECPIHKMGLCNACNKYIAKSPGIINLTELYPNVEFEPGRNLGSILRSDVKLTSIDNKKEAAIEAENTNPDSKEKILQGYPILVLHAKTQQDVDYVRTTHIFDTTNGDCMMENAWALPFMLCQFGCNEILKKYRALYHKDKAQKETKTNAEQEEGGIKHNNHGMSPETKLTKGKFAGEPLDYVMDIDKSNVLRIRQEHPTWYVLTPYARTLYGLEATEIEKLLDKVIDELDRIVDVKPFEGKTVEQIAINNFKGVIWLQKDCKKWEGKRLSKECMEYLSRMYCRKNK